MIQKMDIVKGKTYFNFLEIVYGQNYINEADYADEVFLSEKKGEVQDDCSLLEVWFEW